MKSSTLEPVTGEPRLDPRWNRARALFAQGRQTALEFAGEIEQLRELYLRDKNANLRRGDSPKSHDETSEPDEGFKAAVSRELGVAPATAYRYIAAVKAIGICRQIEAAPKGETIDLPDGKSYPVTEDVRKKARGLRDSIVAGETPINRALPAVAGIFSITDGNGMGGKAATNHPQNMWAGVQKLRTSMRIEHWRCGTMKGDKDCWDKLVAEWDLLVRQLPDELRVCTALILAKSARK